MSESRKDNRDTYTIYDDQSIGTVQIADEVVAIIAGLAAYGGGRCCFHERQYYE